MRKQKPLSRTIPPSPPARKPTGDQDDDYAMPLYAGTVSSTTTTQIQNTSSTQNKNRALDEDVYGARRITSSNRYDKLEQLPRVNGRLGLGLIKLGLKGGRGYKLQADTEGIGDVKRAAESVVKCNILSKRLNGDKLFSETIRLTARDGTVPLITRLDADGITSVEFMPMDRTTLIPKGYKPGYGAGENDKSKLDLMKGQVKYVVVDENLGEEGWKVYDVEKNACLVRLAEEGNEVLDIMGRNTLGLYGVSLVELLDPTVKKLEDMTWGFSKAVGRYGYGRQLVNDKLVEWELQNGKRTRRSAQALVNANKDALKNMGPEEDIVGVGLEVLPVQPLMGGDAGILALKESYEKDIAYGLLDTEAGSAKAAGTTFASSSVADEDAKLVIESMRLQVKRAFETGVFQRHLMALGYDELVAGCIRIELTPLDGPKYTLQELMDLRAMQYIDEATFLELTGIRKKPNAQAAPVSEQQDQPEEPAMDTPVE